MGINRRIFFKTLGLAGGTLALGKSFAAPVNSEVKEFYGILYDSTLCAGCQSCEFGCAEKYELPYPDVEDIPETGKLRKTSEIQRVSINAFETSKGEQYMRMSCNHCNQPACASACLTKAMVKTDEGPVIWQEDKCMGCRSCIVSCPFDIPKFEYDSPNPKIQKCRMCFESLLEGEKPVCVDSCPTEAVIYGKRRDLIEIAKERIYTDPDNYYHKIYGENEAGGTGLLYIASVPFEEIGMRTDLGTTSYPEFNKTFLYSVPAVLVLWPAFLLGLSNANKERNKTNQIEDKS